jgi:hypothetical protein
MKIESIKFKAKRLDGKGWAIGDLLHSYENGAIIVPIEGGGAFSVDHSTVCQFTGLKDCEGKEIWEGDILEGESKSEVVYTKGTFTISFIGYNKRVFSYPLCYYIKEDGTVDGKVVGNKFDKEK